MAWTKPYTTEEEIAFLNRLSLAKAEHQLRIITTGLRRYDPPVDSAEVEYALRCRIEQLGGKGAYES
jgi:hypothetical protein